MKNIKIVIALFLPIVSLGISFLAFEFLTSDVATRVRFALRNGEIKMNVTGRKTWTVEIAPNGWPGGCPKNEAYEIKLIPDDGHKQVAAADIVITCENGHQFSSGTRLTVPRELRVDRVDGETARFKLETSEKGVSVTGLE